MADPVGVFGNGVPNLLPQLSTTGIQLAIAWLFRVDAFGGRDMAMTAGLHPSGDSNSARLVVEYHNSQPIDLLEFSASLQSLAREHQGHLQTTRPGIDVEETRLLVIDVRKGSIVLELAAALAPIISTAEATNTVIAFVDHLRRFATALSRPGGRVPDATTQQLRNFGDAVQAIAADQKGAFVIAARHQSGEVIQEFLVASQQAQIIVDNVQAQRREIEDRSSSTLVKVLMRLHQSSIADTKVGKRTAERGVIEHVDAIPRPLVYVSDLAGQRIKDEILRPDGNPYTKGFIVDVDIETFGGRPRVYRILAVHDVMDIGDE